MQLDVASEPTLKFTCLSFYRPCNKVIHISYVTCVTELWKSYYLRYNLMSSLIFGKVQTVEWQAMHTRAPCILHRWVQPQCPPHFDVPGKEAFQTQWRNKCECLTAAARLQLVVMFYAGNSLSFSSTLNVAGEKMGVAISSLWLSEKENKCACAVVKTFSNDFCIACETQFWIKIKLTVYCNRMK